MTKTAPTQAPQGAQAANGVQHVSQIKQIEQVNQLDPTRLNKLQNGSNTLTSRAVDPVSAKPETNRAISVMSSMMGEIEKGGGMLDKLINGGLHGAKFSNGELLSLQAGMYKYTQELDLTGKVVDKATSGLKDTLKTQV